jgi:hypothetical protein
MSEKRKEFLRQYKRKHGHLPSAFKNEDPDAGIDAALAAVKGTAGEASPVDAESEQGFVPIDLGKIRKALGKPPKPEAAAADQGADYFGLIRAERERTGCSFEQAAIAINKRHPHAWAAMLSKANGGRDFTSRLKK